jgi:hypothetical protein
VLFSLNIQIKTTLLMASANPSQNSAALFSVAPVAAFGARKYARVPAQQVVDL